MFSAGAGVFFPEPEFFLPEPEVKNPEFAQHYSSAHIFLRIHGNSCLFAGYVTDFFSWKENNQFFRARKTASGAMMKKNNCRKNASGVRKEYHQYFHGGCGHRSRYLAHAKRALYHLS